MIKIKVPDLPRDLWLGIHKEQGPFLYDKQSQSKLKDGVIRLFILKKTRMEIFWKNKVKKDFLKTVETNLTENKKGIDEYIKRIKNKRHTSCFSCQKSIDSVNWEICNQCGWIKCECDACGCSWKSYSYNP